MITIFMITFLNLIMGMVVMKTTSPVKMSIILMMMSAMLFVYMYMISSQVWFPTIFFLIFMGGILMMFMILSSVLPNEKSMKSNLMIISIIPVIVSLSINFEGEPNIGMNKMIKSFLDSSSNLITLLTIMILYFFLTIFMLSKEETPMRKFMC